MPLLVSQPSCLSSRQRTSRSIGVGQPAHGAHPSIHLFACSNVCLFVCVCVSISWHVCLSVVGCVSFCLPMHVDMWACLSVRFSPTWGGGGKGGVAWRIGRVEGSLVGLPVWLLLCLLDCSVCLVCLCNFCMQIFIWIHVRLRRHVHVWQGHMYVYVYICILCVNIQIRIFANIFRNIYIYICRKIKAGPMLALFRIKLVHFC